MLYPVKKENKKPFPTIDKGVGKGFAMGKGVFNPNFDGNALSWYDGNIGLTVARWNDRGAGGHDILFVNDPTMVPNATPLRDAVRFDGINQTGVVVTPVINQPFTIYLVVNQIAWVATKSIYDDGVVMSRKTLFQNFASPNLAFWAGTANINGSPDLMLGDYGVITTVYNGVNSEIRTNLNAAVIGNPGNLNGAGITIGSATNLTKFSNCEIGYLIIRTGADIAATQNYLINGLRLSCGLTF